MSKSKIFSGQPIISQILKFIPRSLISRTAQEHNSDRYYKQFKTYDHLVTMLFATISGCNSLREITSIMLACEGKINHLGLTNFPKRSTLSDANKKRSSEVFASIYQSLYNQYRHFLSDSNTKKLPIEDLNIVPSATARIPSRGFKFISNILKILYFPFTDFILPRAMLNHFSKFISLKSSLVCCGVFM